VGPRDAIGTLDVGAAAGEELTGEAQMETAAAHDVGLESVAGNEPAAGQSSCEGTDVEPIALRSPALGEVAFEDHLEAPLAVALDGAGLLRESEATGELAEQREQRQVGPCGRLEPMRLRLRTATAPRATAALRTGSSSRNAIFRLAIPLR